MDNQGAILDFNKAIELNPKYAEVYVKRGLSKILLKDKQSGCQDFKESS